MFENKIFKITECTKPNLDIPEIPNGKKQNPNKFTFVISYQKTHNLPPIFYKEYQKSDNQYMLFDTSFKSPFKKNLTPLALLLISTSDDILGRFVLGSVILVVWTAGRFVVIVPFP